MDRLEVTLLEVSATRSCELLTIIGEAGVGKSRLIREFATRASARDRSQVLRGRCLPYGDGVTFWPIGEIVRSAAGINDEDPLEVALAKIATIARGIAGRTDDSSAIADRVAAAIGLSTTQFPGPELFWGIRKLLEAIATRRPLVAIIDDIHVAAPTFLELLDHLLDAVHGAPILLLASARHELLETRTEWADAHEDDQIVLEPLSADESDAFVDQLLGGLDVSVREQILAAAEGNPLYVEQIASMLVEMGAVRQDGDRWVATSASGSWRSRRPSRRSSRHAWTRCSPRSGSSSTRRPSSASASPSTRSHTSSPTMPFLTFRNVSRPDGETVRSPDRIRSGLLPVRALDHQGRRVPQLAQTEPGRAPRAVRDWAEPINRERGREIEFEEILGYHLEQAYRYRSELGPIDDAVRGVGRRSADKLASAGRRALGRGDLPAAASLLQRAAATLAVDDPDRLALATDLGISLLEQGEFGEATSVLNDAIDHALETGNLVMEARARMVVSFVELYSGDSEDWTQTTAERIDWALPRFEISRR